MAILSIAIPTYNRKDFLKECLVSLLHQSFEDFNIYIFDNHSNYDVSLFLKEFGSSRIFLVESSENLGNAGNFEKIFNHKFDSRYVLIFHDDDVLYFDYIKKAIAVLEKNEDIIWVGSGLRFVKDHKKIFNFSQINRAHYVVLSTADLIKTLLNDFDLCFGSVIYRNFFPFSLRENKEKFGKWLDRPLLVELSKKGKVAIFKDSFVNYRIHPAQDSRAINGLESLGKLKNVYLYYQENFVGMNLKMNDYFTWSTNFLFLDLAGFSRDLQSYFKLLALYKKEGFIRLINLRLRGIVYFFLAIKRIFFNS